MRQRATKLIAASGPARHIAPSRLPAKLPSLSLCRERDGNGDARLDEQARRFAHDLRNLLLAADTRVELAQLDSSAASKAAESLSAARIALAEARALICVFDDVVAQAPRRTQRVDLVELIQAAGRELGALLPPAVQLKLELPADSSLPIDGDGLQLRRLIRNLALNARDAMPQGGRLTVRLDAGPAYIGCGQHFAWPAAARITIADTGVGMSSAVRKRMFESGFTTKARRGGAGLGLAIVRDIATAHGARIEVASLLGRGTSVSVLFPSVRLRLVAN